MSFVIRMCRDKDHITIQRNYHAKGQCSTGIETDTR